MQTKFTNKLRATACSIRTASAPVEACNVLRASGLLDFRARFGWIETAIKDTLHGRFEQAADCLTFLAERLETAALHRQADAALATRPVKRVESKEKREADRRARQLKRAKAGPNKGPSYKIETNGTSRKSVQKRRKDQKRAARK